MNKFVRPCMCLVLRLFHLWLGIDACSAVECVIRDFIITDLNVMTNQRQNGREMDGLSNVSKLIVSYDCSSVVYI